ncbi:MAG: hypothetical protein ACJA2E_000636, partial [Arenicella sp.]
MLELSSPNNDLKQLKIMKKSMSDYRPATQAVRAGQVRSSENE